ncbi:MAG TPA: HAD family hydrolase [Candidatus Synoicihabitans sp.]|nr:HAD family hydrolase [Candidatus Synoicihabitans sp.]
MSFRTVLFDLDGTLIDHLPAIHRSYGFTLPQLGLPAPSYEQVKRAIGGGLENAMRNFVTEEQLPTALRIYREFWDRTMLEGATLMPGALALLEALRARGTRLAVFTNKHGPSSRRICAHLGIADLLAANFGATDTPWLKPQPEFARHVLAALQATAETTCLVGDSPFDVAAARTGGFTFAGVETGTHTAEELRDAGATLVVPGLVELAECWGLRPVGVKTSQGPTK